MMNKISFRREIGKAMDIYMYVSNRDFWVGGMPFYSPEMESNKEGYKEWIGIFLREYVVHPEEGISKYYRYTKVRRNCKNKDEGKK